MAKEVIVLDFDKWTLEESDSFQRAQISGDDATLDTLIAKLVAQWPFAEAVHSELSMEDAGRVLRTINEEFRKLSQEEHKDLEFFGIDLTGWRFKDFAKFSRSLSASDYAALADLLTKVVNKWPYEYELNGEAFTKISVEAFFKLTGSVAHAVKNAFQGN